MRTFHERGPQVKKVLTTSVRKEVDRKLAAFHNRLLNSTAHTAANDPKSLRALDAVATLQDPSLLKILLYGNLTPADKDLVWVHLFGPTTKVPAE